MKNPLSSFTIAIPVPIPIFQQLCDHRQRTGSREELSDLAAAAIVEWLARAEQPSGLQQAPAMNGYQWKEVYLPTGTLLRTAFAGNNHHAIVKGDRIDFNGRSVSPSEFVNAVGGVGRNAWRALWLYFPNAQEWKRADSCRDKDSSTRVRRPSSAHR